MDMMPAQHSRDIRSEIENLSAIPAIPELAQRLLALGPHPDARKLVEIVELDPGLAGQMVRQATSPFFGYRGKVNSVNDAVTRVLGLEPAMHLAFGVIAGKAMRSPADGPVGRKAVWLHGAYSAALMQSLAEGLPGPRRALPGMCYLGGLLHNIGLLLLGHVYPSDLHALNKAITENPAMSVIDLERQLFMTDHTEIGALLMRKWNMPEEVVVAVQRHHDEDYRGEYAIYANLALLADRLLKRLDKGDADSAELPAALMDDLDLQESDVMDSVQRLLEARSDLDSLASHMGAT
jgi:HD-like signal output (HDOD) protein